ncbi:hypothetical protein EP331_13685 [bacterium]|nr:MAG: hypothetical protein EP331_13685 [bacterium]
MNLIDDQKIELISLGDSTVYKELIILLRQLISETESLLVTDTSDNFFENNAAVIHKLKPNIKLLCSDDFFNLVVLLDNSYKNYLINDETKNKLNLLAKLLGSAKKEIDQKLASF